jgi:8-oxo-dGTP diphosphatase
MGRIKMKLIKELSLEHDVKCEKYRIRKASRSICFNKDNKIALLHVSRHGYHKLPGGGIEEGEDIYEALRREMLEEAGVEIEITGEIGIIIEYRNEFGVLQISYCYKSKVIGELGVPQYTDKEKEEGFILEWKTIDEAIELLKTDNPDNYEGRFNVKRELEILKEINN